MRGKFPVVLALSAIAVTLLGSACTPERHVSAHKSPVVSPVVSPDVSSAIPDIPAFKNNDYTLSANWVNQYWSNTAVSIGADNCARDVYGACMVDRDGTYYNHPVVQANDGLYSLALFAKTGTAAYLNRAVLEANRILSYKTAYANAWWYPYEFSFAEYGESQDTLTAPWYSAYAQGAVLDLFTQLYKVTRAAAWKADAGKTFTSFLDLWTPSTGTEPWVDIVDSSGYLWLEEYPTNPNDDVINGADFAIWGLVDYANEFHSAAAAYLASGALTTMLYAISLVRNPGWIVGYSVSHPTDEIQEYHLIVTEQFLSFAQITNSSAFADIALELVADFPIYPISGSITLAAGSQLMAQVGENFMATSVGTVNVPANTTARVTARVKLANEPGYWYVVAGSAGSASNPYGGLYVQEQAGTAYYPGVCNQLAFTPALQTTFPAGSYLLYTSNGQVLTEQSALTLSNPELLPASSQETIGGITVWAISSGIYAGDFITGPTPTID
jgi:D-glucuronyl C5-epimerase C-terminus